MLPSDYLDSVADDVVKIYDNLELDIIKEISKRVVNVGYANTVVQNNAIILEEMGYMYENIIQLVAKYSNKSEQEIKNIFAKAGIKTLEYDDNIYKEAGLNPLPIKQSKSMLQLLTATTLKTNKNLNNLVRTTANTTQNDFINTMNKSYLEVSSGAKSYSQSIIESIKELGNKNILVQYSSGYKTSIESAVRMNIVTNVSQACGKLQEIRADEMSWDLMELTAHSGARPEHAEWQGKIVSRSGQKGYLSFKDIGYGEPTGFKGVNCRHDWYPYYKDSSRTYADNELDKFKNERVIVNGEEMSKYEATQMQRYTERKIRQNKKELVGLQSVINSANNNKLIEDAKTEFAKRSLIYNSNIKELNSIVHQINTRVDNTRLYVANDYNKSIGAKAASVTKIAKQYNNSDIVGLKVNNIEITEIGEHIISRTYARNINIADVEDSLKNPLDYGKIRKDDGQQIIGEFVTIAINTKTGKLTTIWPTSAKKAKKLKERKGKENEDKK